MNGPTTVAREPDHHLPDDIAASWRRTSATGLRSADDVRVNPTGGPSQGRLARAASAILGRFESEIADAPFAVALVDRTCRVVDVRFGRRSMLSRAADTIGLVPGARFDEENTGTNGLSVPFETKDEVFIEGDQHYLESMRGFTCFGQPIHNPVTARFEGVIDIMAYRHHASALMRPALCRLVEQISTELAATTNPRSRTAYEVFRAESAAATAPMVLLDDDLTIANRAARQELEAADYTALHEIVASAPGHPSRRLVLRSGAVAVVKAVPIDDAVICTLIDETRPRAVIPRGVNASRTAGETLRRGVDRLRRLPGTHVAVVGEGGTGRSTVARQITEAVDTIVHRCTGESTVDDPALERLTDLDGHAAVVVDDADRLSLRNLVRLVAAMGDSPARFVVTMAPTEANGPEHQAVLASCAETLVLPPLRERSDELGAVTAGMLDELTADSRRVSLAALRVLRSRRWPGNFHELRGVLRAAAQRRGSGDIGTDDLPPEFADSRARPAITSLQKSEADAIERALRSTNGNKTRAATRLGISRSTLYARIRTYEINV